MVLTLLKYLLISTLIFSSPEKSIHPFYVTVTEIEHNANAQTLEISCKIFTDDFEHTLRKHYNGKIDLINPENQKSTAAIVNDYIKKHLKINVNGANAEMVFIGYEKKEEGIISYFEIEKIKTVKRVVVTNNLLYDYMPEQIGIIHLTVSNKRQSTKLVNPDDNAEFEF